jgi:ectoine/hydroxyectoine ABC transporter permease protein EhuD
MFQVLVDYAPDFLSGTGLTVFLTISSMSIALTLALPIALARSARHRVVRILASVYVDFFRGTPLLLQLFYLYFVLPYVGIRMPALVAGIAGLSLNYAAYLSEVYRATIDAVDRGQREAAFALGMSESLAFRRVVLPQALRIAVPPIGNYLIAMFKDTALVAVIAVKELLFTAQGLANTTYQYLEVFTIVFIIYFAISYPASVLVKRLERRLAKRTVRPSGSLTDPVQRPDLAAVHQ